MQAKFHIEPLKDHDRQPFTCGVVELDRYLWHQAGQDARRHVATPFVMIRPPQKEILGYYTLSAYGVALQDLPVAIAAKLPRYPLVPATLLGRLAVKSTHRGQGLGAALLIDALQRALRATVEVASGGVIAEAIDASAIEFYKRHGFLPLLGQDRKLFLSMSTIQKTLAERPDR